MKYAGKIEIWVFIWDLRQFQFRFRFFDSFQFARYFETQWADVVISKTEWICSVQCDVRITLKPRQTVIIQQEM